MSWIEKLQNKPRHEKIRIVWITAIVTGIILIGLWIVVGNVQPSAEKNLDLFKTIGNSIKNFHIDTGNSNTAAPNTK